MTDLDLELGKKKGSKTRSFRFFPVCHRRIEINFAIIHFQGLEFSLSLCLSRRKQTVKTTLIHKRAHSFRIHSFLDHLEDVFIITIVVERCHRYSNGRIVFGTVRNKNSPKRSLMNGTLEIVCDCEKKISQNQSVTKRLFVGNKTFRFDNKEKRKNFIISIILINLTIIYRTKN